MLLTHFTYLKVTERIFVAYLGLPAQHCSLAYFYLYTDYPGIRGYSFFFFFCLSADSQEILGGSHLSLEAHSLKIRQAHSLVC